jgi:hypothetical protein
MGGSKSSCWPEGDQKRSDCGEKFLGYFSCRTSVVQQPESFAKNSNFANALLLRNLVFRSSFHLKEPPPWKLLRNTRYPYRCVGRRRVDPSRVICPQESRCGAPVRCLAKNKSALTIVYVSFVPTATLQDTARTRFYVLKTVWLEFILKRGFGPNNGQMQMIDIIPVQTWPREERFSKNHVCINLL